MATPARRAMRNWLFAVEAKFALWESAQTKAPWWIGLGVTSGSKRIISAGCFKGAAGDRRIKTAGDVEIAAAIVAEFSLACCQSRRRPSRISRRCFEAATDRAEIVRHLIDVSSVSSPRNRGCHHTAATKLPL